jgi:hypothetical protein
MDKISTEELLKTYETEIRKLIRHKLKRRRMHQCFDACISHVYEAAQKFDINKSPLSKFKHFVATIAVQKYTRGYLRNLRYVQLPEVDSKIRKAPESLIDSVEWLEIKGKMNNETTGLTRLVWHEMFLPVAEGYKRKTFKEMKRTHKVSSLTLYNALRQCERKIARMLLC